MGRAILAYWYLGGRSVLGEHSGLNYRRGGLGYHSVRDIMADFIIPSG